MKKRARKTQSLANIYEAYANDVYRLAMHLTQDEALAREIVVETFRKLYQHVDYANIDGMKAWLVGTAKGLIEQLYKEGQGDTMGEVIPLSSREEHTEKIEKNEISRGLFEQLALEHKTWYEAWMLVQGLKKPHLEAAIELGITVEALRSRLHSAEQWFQKHQRRTRRNWSVLEGLRQEEEEAD